MDTYAAFRAPELASALKENVPPKKAKRTISVSGLFDQTQVLRQKAHKTSNDIFAPKPSGIAKPLLPKQTVGAHYRKLKKAAQHPLYLSFADAANEYQRGVAASRGQQLEPVYDALVARVDGLDIQGKQLHVTGLPSKSEIDSVVGEDIALSKSLDEEQMTIQNHRKNGTVETKEIKLGDTMRAFQRLAEQKRAEREGLLQQLKDVDREIVAAKEDIVQTERSGMNKIKKEFEANLNDLITQAEDLKDTTQAEVEKARKDDQKAKNEISRKLNEIGELS